MASKKTALPASASTANKPYFADWKQQPSSDDNGEGSKRKNGRPKACIVAGATGYIGRAVVRESIARGYETFALVRNATAVVDSPWGREAYGSAFDGATVLQCDVSDGEALTALLSDLESGSSGDGGVDVDVLVSCLASPSGIEKEVYSIDYQATLNLLHAGRDELISARHFVLLSAFCVRNPLLKLQQAKLDFEAQLCAQTDLTYSIVRPTAFFKSVSGQLESIMDGNSYVLFGDGSVTSCNPIAEEELAEFMMNSAVEEGMKNRVLNVGGPDEPLTNKMLGEMMFKSIGKRQKFVYVPTWIFDASIDLIDFISEKKGRTQKWEDVLETAKIGKYYAVEDMLTTDPVEKYGVRTMQSHFDKIAAEGQDPFTPVRATAIISRTLDALPAVSISIPVGYTLATKPGVMDAILGGVLSPLVDGGGGGPLSNFQMVLAELTDNVLS